MALPANKISPLGNYREQPNQAYITTKPFNGKVFTYSTYVDSNFVTQGSLVANSAYSTAANSPAGRVLHANGRILLPGVNPGVSKYYLGVLDPATGQKGFIDPSDPTFAKYDVNLPVQYDLGTQSVVPPLGGQGAKLQVGPATPFAIFSATVSGATLTVASVSAGTLQVGMTVNVGTYITSGQTILSLGTGTGGAGTYTLSANADATAGSAVTMYASQNGTSGSPLNTSVGMVALDGAGGSTVVYTTACTATSIVMLTQVAGTATAVTVLAANGSFTISGLDDGAFNYVIIN